MAKRRASAVDANIKLEALAGYEYEVIRSDRRSFGMQVRGDASVRVMVPRRASRMEIAHFVESNLSWVRAQVAKVQKKRAAEGPMERLSAEELKTLHKSAAIVLPERCAVWAMAVGVTYGRITIRTQRTKWGSCSATGNLNFNCLLMLMPPEVIDYVVVHELCHRIEMNHSQAFWNEVARVMPEYEKPKRWLKEHGDAYMLRLPEA